MTETNQPLDMMSDEWLDEFERNWGITPQSASTDTEPQRRNSKRTTDLNQEESCPSEE